MAMFEFKEIARENEFNPLTIRDDTPFTQGPIYGKWQEMMGRKVRRFEIKNGTETISFFQIIKYSLPFSQSFLYIPHGPILKEISYLDSEFLKIFRDKLINLTKEENAVFVRFDFSCLAEALAKAGPT